jgi:hypothetical protein
MALDFEPVMEIGKRCCQVLDRWSPYSGTNVKKQWHHKFTSEFMKVYRVDQKMSADTLYLR